MNTRILDLLENPNLLQADDLKLLNEQIKATPYVQSLRALALLAASRFDPEDYRNVLSRTAAYTTDKKILFQLVNGRTTALTVAGEAGTPAVSAEQSGSTHGTDEKSQVDDVVADIAANLPAGRPVNAETDNTTAVEDAPGLAEKAEEKTFTKITPAETSAAKPVYVNGELNRILFEGEEDFLQQATPVIDKEASAESGKLVIADANMTAPKVFSEESAPVNKLAAREDEVFEAEEEAVSDAAPETETHEDIQILPEAYGEEPAAADVSFHGIAPFLPEVKITATPKKDETTVPPAPVSNKHEAEMQRLIAEVERKIKEKKAAQIQKTPLEEEAQSSEISFSDTQDFLVKSGTPAPVTPPTVAEEPSQSVSGSDSATMDNVPASSAGETDKSRTIDASNASVRTGWKPMSVSLHTPDALLKTEEQLPKAEFEITQEATEEMKTVEEVPVIQKKPSRIEAKSVDQVTEPVQCVADDDSNVPHFINTWQNWLKIDRKEAAPPVVPVPEEDRKTVIIEKFIETAPRISQLREEGNFVIKEKKSDISHLMTETLANIYVEQKLYARAIHAFHILAEKHPQKADYFKTKVKEVRDLRNNFQ